jgi:hypothetical protein
MLIRRRSPSKDGRLSAGWALLRNGEPGADYATAEAAFEVAAAKSSIEMRSDNEIIIHVRPANKSTDAGAG